jgi:hypothetical protein
VRPSPHLIERLGRGVGRALAYAYIPAIAVVAAVRAITGADIAHQWATNPALVDQGAVWTLFSSALVLDRVQALQLIIAALLTWILLRRHGPGALWSALLLGHVGSTLLAYAGIGVLWDTGAALHAADHTADFGISCVWTTILAMLIAGAIMDVVSPTAKSLTWALVLGLILVYIPVAIAAARGIADAEHILAVGAGIATALWSRRADAPRLRSRVRAAAPAATTGSEPGWV